MPIMTRARWIMLIPLLGVLALGGVAGGVYAVLNGVSDATRAAIACRILSRALPGDFAIAGIGPGMPRDIEVRGVRFASPAHEPVIEVDHLSAHSTWGSLLRGQLNFSDIVVDHAIVHVRAAEDGPVDIAATFDEKQLHKKPPSDDVEAVSDGPPHVLCENILVRQAEVLINVSDTQLHFTDAHVQDANLWVRGNVLGLEAKATAHMVLKVDDESVQQRHIEVDLQPTQYRFATNNEHLETPGVRLALPGLVLNARGTLDATEKGVQAVDGKITLHLDTALQALAPHMPAKVRALLRGKLVLRAEVAGTGAQQKATVDLAGDKLRFADVGFDDGHFDLLATPHKGVTGTHLHVQQALMHVEAVAIRVEGDAVGTWDGWILQHDLRIDTESLPLRRILKPFVNVPDYIPARVSLKLHTHGPSLWPLGSDVTFKALASGNSAPALRALPDPFMISGDLHTHKTAIDIRTLSLGSESLPLRLEGTLPLRADGVMDIIHDVHLKR